MKICHLTSAHTKQDIRIFQKQCKSLAAAGYNVFLIATSEEDEVQDGVKIIGLQTERNRFKGLLTLIWSIYRKAVENNADIIHFHDLELIPVGIMLSLRGKKVVYDVHEDVPRQIHSMQWITPWLRYPLSWTVAFVEWLSSHIFFSTIVAATPTIAELFPKRKTVLVQNFPISNDLTCKKRIPYSKRPNNIVYVGGIIRIKGALESIKAFSYIKNTNCCFSLSGPFENNLFEKECRKLVVGNKSKIVFTGWLDRDGIAEVFSEARVGLVLYHPEPNNINAQPNKLFEYMSAGIPVIASHFPLWRQVIESEQCGLLVDPMNPKDIAKAIDWVLDNPEKAEQMGKNGQQAVSKRYNWLHEEKKLLDSYRNFDQ